MVSTGVRPHYEWEYDSLPVHAKVAKSGGLADEIDPEKITGRLFDIELDSWPYHLCILYGRAK